MTQFSEKCVNHYLSSSQVTASSSVFNENKNLRAVLFMENKTFSSILKGMVPLKRFHFGLAIILVAICLVQSWYLGAHLIESTSSVSPVISWALLAGNVGLLTHVLIKYVRHCLLSTLKFSNSLTLVTPAQFKEVCQEFPHFEYCPYLREIVSKRAITRFDLEVSYFSFLKLKVALGTKSN